MLEKWLETHSLGARLVANYDKFHKGEIGSDFLKKIEQFNFKNFESWHHEAQKLEPDLTFEKFVVLLMREIAPPVDSWEDTHGDKTKDYARMNLITSVMLSPSSSPIGSRSSALDCAFAACSFYENLKEYCCSLEQDSLTGSIESLEEIIKSVYTQMKVARTQLWLDSLWTDYLSIKRPMIPPKPSDSTPYLSDPIQDKLITDIIKLEEARNSSNGDKAIERIQDNSSFNASINPVPQEVTFIPTLLGNSPPDLNRYLAKNDGVFNATEDTQSTHNMSVNNLPTTEVKGSFCYQLSRLLCCSFPN